MLYSASQFRELPVLTLPLCAVRCLWGLFITANPVSGPWVIFSPLFSFAFACLVFTVLPVSQNVFLNWH